MTLVIARASIESIPDADRLIHEAANWLIAKGEPLWGPNETSFEELQRVARAEELVMGRIEQEAVACMYLHNEDKLFWPDDEPGEAFYIHRLAVTRKYAGRGFAHAMLRWAENEVRAKNRRFLRLDCEPRAKLLTIYADAGFTRIDASPIQVGEHFVVRHEKQL